MMPVHDRVVEAKLDAGLFAFLGQVFHRIVLVERRHNAPIGKLRVIHRKTVVVLAGNDDVFRAGVFGDLHPSLGVELDGIERVAERFILGSGDLSLLHDPLGVGFIAVPLACRDGIHAPVDKHAELRLTEPFHPGVALLLCLVHRIACGIGGKGACPKTNR